MSDSRGFLHKPTAVSVDAVRGAEMMSELLARAAPADPPLQLAILNQLTAAERQLLLYVRFYSHWGDGAGKSRLSERRCAPRYHHDKDDFDVAQIKDEGSFGAYSFRQYGFIWDPANVAFCADSEEWTTDLVRYSKGWLALHRQYPKASFALDPAYILARGWLGLPNRLAKRLRFEPELRTFGGGLCPPATRSNAK